MLDTDKLRLDPADLSPGHHNLDWADHCSLTPKQRMALDLCVAHPRAKVLYGGAGFCGKSYLLRCAAVYFAILFAALGFPGQRGMLVCKDYPSLRDRHVADLQQHLGILGEFKQDDGMYGMCFKFHDPRLGVLLLRNLQDPDRLRGSQVSYVLVDELTELTEDVLPALMYCLRSPHPLPFLPILAGSNPDGLGFSWVKKLWVQRDFTGENFNPDEFHFIQALVTDNPHLNANDYVQTLAGLPEWLRRARLEGSWEAPACARWPALNAQEHQFRTTEVFPHGIPPTATILMGVDWGVRDPFCALWIVEDADGRNYYVVRECYQRDLASEQQARQILHRTRGQERVQRVYCDSQMWERRRDLHRANSAVGESAGEVYTQILRQDGRFGSIQPAYKGPRIHPLDTLDRLLARGNDYPDLWIERGCEHLWRELQGAVWDTREGLQKREDIDPRNPDHAITALYYALHTHLHGTYKTPTDLNPLPAKDSWLQRVEREEERYLADLTIRGARTGRYFFT